MVWRYVVDDVILEQNIRGLTGALIIMISAQALGLLFSTLQSYLLDSSGQQLVRDLRVNVFQKLTQQSPAYHGEHRSGDLITRVISDIDAMESSVLKDMSNLLEECFTFLVVGGIVIYLQPVVGLTTMLPLIVSFFVIRYYSVRLKRIYEKVRARLGEIGGYIQDRLQGMTIVQSYAREKAEVENVRGIVSAHYDRSIDALKMRTKLFPLVSFWGFSSNVVMLGMGAWFIWKGEFTIGGLIAYRGYWWRLQSPIGTLARMSDTLMRARAAAQRVLQVLDEPVDIQSAPDARKIAKISGDIVFDHVHFSYTEDAPILKGIQFQIRPGEFVAIAGKSGSGKSTMLNLLMRFREANQGSILVDQQDISTLDLESYRQRIALVSQDSYLFHQTIAENIRFARPEATNEEVVHAAKTANAHEFIERLPQGYDSLTGERGVKLSGGQRQRLSLARAFLSNPDLLLLDEPTSAIEPGSEEMIHQAILEGSQGKTTLIVTHRINILRRAPRILFLHQGQLIGDGSHQDLLANSPEYARAYHEWEWEELTEGI